MGPLRSIIFLMFAVAAAASSLGAGCTVNGGGNSGGDPYAGYDSDRAGIDDYEEGAVRRYDDDAPPPPVVVEREEERPLVPRTARLRVEGRGDLSFKAPRDGYVFIVDSRERKLVYDGPLDEGETVLVAPYRNQIEVDGQRVKRVKDLDNKHIHRIFFEREGTRGRGRGRD